MVISVIIGTKPHQTANELAKIPFRNNSPKIINDTCNLVKLVIEYVSVRIISSVAYIIKRHAGRKRLVDRTKGLEQLPSVQVFLPFRKTSSP